MEAEILKPVPLFLIKPQDACSLFQNGRLKCSQSFLMYLSLINVNTLPCYGGVLPECVAEWVELVLTSRKSNRESQVFGDSPGTSCDLLDLSGFAFGVCTVPQSE